MLYLASKGSGRIERRFGELFAATKGRALSVAEAAVIELSQQVAWLAVSFPGSTGIRRRKLPPDEETLLRLLYRWRDEAIKAGRKIIRMAVAFEAGRDGLWLARWLRSRGIDLDGR
jgi:hypothetical protein